MYDCIVIGAGIAGAACARKLAEEAGKKVLVIERRNHVGGNCYDVLDEYAAPAAAARHLRCQNAR